MKKIRGIIVNLLMLTTHIFISSRFYTKYFWWLVTVLEKSFEGNWAWSKVKNGQPYYPSTTLPLVDILKALWRNRELARFMILATLQFLTPFYKEAYSKRGCKYFFPSKITPSKAFLIAAFSSHFYSFILRYS